METPEAFRRFAQLFHQDVFAIYDGPLAAIEAYVADMPKADLVEIDAYLTKLLASEDSRNSLKNHWRKLNGDIYFNKAKGALEFYKAVHESVQWQLEFLRTRPS